MTTTCQFNHVASNVLTRTTKPIPNSFKCLHVFRPFLNEHQYTGSRPGSDGRILKRAFVFDGLRRFRVGIPEIGICFANQVPANRGSDHVR